MESVSDELKELSDFIKKSLDLYRRTVYALPDNGSIKQVIKHPDAYFYNPSEGKPNADERLRASAVKLRTDAVNLWQRNQQLPEPPTTNSNAATDLQNLRQWCIKAEAPTQPEQKPSASGKARENIQAPPKIEHEKDIKEKRERVLEPKPPEFLQKLLWILKYGKKYWKLILLAILILLAAGYILPKFGLFGKISTLIKAIHS